MVESRHLLLLTTVFWLASCDTAAHNSSDQAGVTMRDSAGVRIVENQDSAWTTTARWRIAEEPDLVLGSIDGSSPGTDWGGSPSAYSVGDRIAVLDRPSRSVRVFDRDGTFIAHHDVRGDGPGEIRGFFENGPVDERRVALFDGGRQRILVVDVVSGERESYAVPEIPSGGYSLYPIGWAGDGSPVMYESFWDALYGEDLEPGVQIMNQPYHRFDPSGEHLGQLIRLPVASVYYVDERTLGEVQWARQADHAVRGSTMWHGFPPAGLEFTRIDLERGEKDLITRLADLPRESIPTSFAERHREEGLARVRGRYDNSAPPVRAWSELVYAESMPQFDDVSLSPDGTLWIQRTDFGRLRSEVAGEEDPRPRSFFVVASDGRWLGTLQLPLNTELLDVQPDHVLTVRNDDLGVAWIERWQIIKPE